MNVRRPNVLLMGASLGTGNRGVSALSASLVKLVLRNRPEAEVGLLIGHRTKETFTIMAEGVRHDIGVMNFRRSFKARPSEHVIWWAWLSVLYRALPSNGWRRFLRHQHPLIAQTADAAFVGDIRGGDSFSDIYGLGNFLWACLPVFAVLQVRGRIVLLPQTYGPFKSALGRSVASYILNRASVILCRDEEGLAAVKELAPDAIAARFCPDVAFCLDAAAPPKPLIEPPYERGQIGCLVGLNVNGLVYNGGYTRDNMFGLKLDYRRYLIDAATALLADPSTHLLLVPHTFAPDDSVESDPAACVKLREQLLPGLQTRVHTVRGEYDQNEIKGIIGLCDFFIGSRMHACIAALSQGIPTVGVAYSKKFKGVFESVGMPGSVLDGREYDSGVAVEKTMEIFQKRELLRDSLVGAVKEAQEKLYATFRELLAGSKNPREVDPVPRPAPVR